MSNFFSCTDYSFIGRFWFLQIFTNFLSKTFAYNEAASHFSFVSFFKMSMFTCVRVL